MKRNLLFKLMICFILLNIVVLGLVNTLGYHLMKSHIINTRKESLYNEAALISAEYLNLVDSNDLTLTELSNILKSVHRLTDVRIWIVNINGTIICDTNNIAPSLVGLNVNLYDSNFLSNEFVKSTTINGLLEEESLSVIYPIPYNYKLRSSIVLLLPYSMINGESIAHTNLLTILSVVILLVILLSFVYIYFMTARPLYKIRKAAMEYARGNFKYQLIVKGKDEFHDVAAALNYMAGELESLDKYQKKFIANISHDFRSPLTSIKGYAEAILDGTIPFEMQNKYLDIIVFEIERLTKLTNNILELNSFDSKQNRLHITSFDVNQIIKSTCASFEGVCIKKKIQINLLFSDKELYVHADLGKIQQVLYNLIDNAIKFSHTNSEIKVSSTEKGDKVFVSVKDYGVGIPKNSINKIWERFYKQDSSRGKDKKGTGLGLSITKEIILAHNENIDVISTEGVGSEFTFSLARTDS